MQKLLPSALFSAEESVLNLSPYKVLCHEQYVQAKLGLPPPKPEFFRVKGQLLLAKGQCLVMISYSTRKIVLIVGLILKVKKFMLMEGSSP